MGTYYYYNLIPAIDKANGSPWKWNYNWDGELVSITVPYFRIFVTGFLVREI